MEPTTNDRAARSWNPDGLAMVGVVVATLVFWLWRVPAAQRGVVYAEDGEVFLLQWTWMQPGRALLEPYAGYQHLVPRILSGLADGLLPLERYGLAVHVASVLVLAAIAAATVVLARDVVASLLARVALALVPVVLPLAGAEVLGNLANLHTYCLWLALWLLLWRPRAWWSAAFAAVAMLLATMTEVQTVLLLPLAALRLAWMRERMVPIVAAFLVGVAGQATSWVLAPRASPEDAGIDVADVVVGWLVTAVRPILLPSDAAALATLRDVGPAPFLLVLLPFAAAVAVVLAWGDARQRVASVATCLLSACLFGGSVLATPFSGFDWALREGDEWGTVMLNLRYGAAAGMWVAAQVPLAVGVLLDRLARGEHPSAPPMRAARVAVGAVAVALVATMAVIAPQSGSVRDGGAGWLTEVDEGALACEAGAETVDLAIVPSGRLVTMACDELLERAVPGPGA
ncbi:hypothetical protein GCM10009846_06670 [Agrococcus versicolor]|uniref:DUF2029 domain-containing protein n=1 Tax=Agrococcus versicolor TaxID=501482 RepID=A0ABP5MAT2_9MICO